MTPFKITKCGAVGDCADYELNIGDRAVLIDNKEYIEGYKYQSMNMSKYLVRVDKKEDRKFEYSVGTYGLITNIWDNYELIKKF